MKLHSALIIIFLPLGSLANTNSSTISSINEHLNKESQIVVAGGEKNIFEPLLGLSQGADASTRLLETAKVGEVCSSLTTNVLPVLKLDSLVKANEAVIKKGQADDLLSLSKLWLKLAQCQTSSFNRMVGLILEQKTLQGLKKSKITFTQEQKEVLSHVKKEIDTLSAETFLKQGRQSSLIEFALAWSQAEKPSNITKEKNRKGEKNIQSVLHLLTEDFQPGALTKEESAYFARLYETPTSEKLASLENEGLQRLYDSLELSKLNIKKASDLKNKKVAARLYDILQGNKDLLKEKQEALKKDNLKTLLVLEIGATPLIESALNSSSEKSVEEKLKVLKSIVKTL